MTDSCHGDDGMSEPSCGFGSVVELSELGCGAAGGLARHRTWPPFGAIEDEVRAQLRYLAEKPIEDS